LGQDRVRPLALALQGLDYTIGGEMVCVWGVDVGGGIGECSLICQQEVRTGGGDEEGTTVRLDWI